MHIHEGASTEKNAAENWGKGWQSFSWLKSGGSTSSFHPPPGGGLSSWSQDLMKLTFLMSHHRKNSMRKKVIGKKCLPGGSAVKKPPAVQETWVWSLGQEDLLEEEIATHSSILAWIILQTEEPGRLQSMGSQKSWTQLSNKTTKKWICLEKNALHRQREPLHKSRVTLKYGIVSFHGLSNFIG